MKTQNKTKLSAVLIVALSAGLVRLAASPDYDFMRTNFGKTPDGQTIELYTLKNRHGITAKVMTYGAILTELRVPDRQGHLADIVLGYDDLEGYLKGTSHFGATIGRFGNRIAQGRFTLNGQKYVLEANNGANHLHGGTLGFDRLVWQAASSMTDRGPSVTFSRLSPDGESGYPGNLTVKATYTLTDDDTLELTYEAVTDKATLVNLTNHSYFNLAGAGSGDISGHVIQIDADRFTPVDAGLIPTGVIEPVAGTLLDFSKPALLKTRMEQIKPDSLTGSPLGFDINMVLRASPAGVIRPVATVYEPNSGRVLKVSSDQPAVQFYTGNFLAGSPGKEGKPYHQHYAFCLETQHFPDSVNHPSFPSVLLQPGETYHTRTVWEFSTRQ
ncbi:MAG: galactose mutarotase [Lacunisphaera sp.]|nr:galactose mutarotase [Lacunisphaera sp.]